MWKQLKQQIWNWRGVLVVTPTVATVLITLRLLGWLQDLELAVFDQYVRWRPHESFDNRIVIVAITEADLKAIGDWPISDAILARLLDKIRQQQPRAIGLDLYRDLPVEPGHAALVRTFKAMPNLVGVENINAINPDAGVAPPPTLNQLGQIGMNNVVVDSDGTLRRGLLQMIDKDHRPIPALGLVLAQNYLEAKGINPELIDAHSGRFRWGKATFQPLTANEGGYAGADAGGYQILLNYRGAAGSFATVSLTQVLNGTIRPDLMRDRIVLIGSTAASLNDFYYTPYSSAHLVEPELTPGVEIHANLISQLLSAALEGRHLIKTWSEPTEIIWILLWSGLGAYLSWTKRYTNGVKLLSLQKLAVFLTAGMALWSITFVAFLQGWWLPVVPAGLAWLGTTAAVIVYVAFTAGEIRKTFGRYLSDQVVASLLENPDNLKLGGESRKITILTSDLRGFTAVSEQLSPQEIVRILNLYLSHMVRVITSYHGTIDEFMGDGILAYFGTPVAYEDAAEQATACALAMQLAMQAVNAEMVRLGFPKLEMGIGINTGTVVVGNIGSETRVKYGAIGSAVNLAYRIESYTVGGQILISESTFREIKKPLRTEGQKQIHPKGIQAPLTVYEVDGIGDRYNLFLPRNEEHYVTLPQIILVQFARLDEKHVNSTLFKGRLIKLSEKGAQMDLENQQDSRVLEPWCDLKILLLSDIGQPDNSIDIYAKVLAQSIESGSFYLHFTYRPPVIEELFMSLYHQLHPST